MDMASADLQPSGLAFNVCLRCKGRKKKCDKILPSCSRCTRLQVRCQYNSSESRGISTPPESENASSDSCVAAFQDHYSNFFPELTGPFHFLLQQHGGSTPLGERRQLSLDEHLTEQCCDIISRDGDDLLVSCSRYFSFIHTWFPIIAKEEFYGRVSHLRAAPQGEFSVLVLTIYLVSEMFRPVPRPIESLEQIYYTTKSFHSILMSTGRSSIEVIQTGILIAVYEHFQALHDSTYQTLGACARMGYTLGFDKSLSQDILPDTQANLVVERRRQVWWGIIILERISMLEYIDKRLPFAIPTPSVTDILPSDDGIRAPASHGLGINGAAVIDDSIELSVNARIAQGAYLLSYVIDRVSSTDPTTSSCGGAHLDNVLRSYGMTLLQPKGSGHFCFPYSICLSALLTLNRFEASAEPQPEEAHEKHLFQSRAALGFQSVLRMIIEGARQTLNTPEIQVISTPIWCFHRSFLAASMSLELGIVDEDKENWTIYLQAVKRMLKIVEPRWKLAENYLKAIEDIESRRAQTLRC